jgi:hypothetical protein
MVEEIREVKVRRRRADKWGSIGFMTCIVFDDLSYCDNFLMLEGKGGRWDLGGRNRINIDKSALSTNYRCI